MPKPTDSVVDEVRAAREAYAARFGFDLEAIGRDLQERERVGARAVLSPPDVEEVDSPATPVGHQAGPTRLRGEMPRR